MDSGTETSTDKATLTPCSLTVTAVTAGAIGLCTERGATQRIYRKPRASGGYDHERPE
jgi:hypothetical protein